MKRKKIISLCLSVSLIVGTITFSPNTTKVYAAELNNIGKITYDNNTVETSTDIINVIENNYLNQKDDGTFYISDEAYKVIDSEVLDFFKVQMAEINDLILDKQLAFEIEETKNGVEIKNTVDNLDESKLSRSVSSGKILSSYTYCSNYEWHWWGYKTKVNSSGCRYLLNYTEAEAAVYGSLCGLAAVIPGGAVGAAVAAVGGTITYGAAIAAFKNGIDSGYGVWATGFGDPSNGHLLKVSAIF